MPIATPEVYAEMLRRAKENSYAFPAINCTSSETVNAAHQGFRRRGQRRHHPVLHRRCGVRLRARGQGHGDRRGGAGQVRPQSSRPSTRSTSRCTPTTVPRTSWTPTCARCWRSRPSGWRPARTRCSSRTCGTARRCRSTRTWSSRRSCSRRPRPPRSSWRSRSAWWAVKRTASRPRSTTSSTPLRRTSRRPSTRWAHGEHGHYLLAATFGNVHGVYKPGNVKLRPDILAQGQKVASAKLGLPDGSKPFDFVFHGGSGSLKSEIEEALRYGVVKMNVDTDTQYAFTRPIAASHVHQLRRRAEGRRRGGQQEGLRPAQLPEEGRGVDDRAGYRGLQRLTLRRQVGSAGGRRSAIEEDPALIRR